MNARLIPMLALGSACVSGHPTERNPDQQPGRSPVRYDASGASVELAGLHHPAQFDTLGFAVPSSHAGGFRVQTLRWGDPTVSQEVPPARPYRGKCDTLLSARTGCSERIEYDRGNGLVEWWLPRDRGVEQGWTILTPPTPEKSLIFDLFVEGEVDVNTDGTGATVLDTAGRIWTVEEVVAWDAVGSGLPAKVLNHHGGLRVEVDVTNAAYPITVDPVYETSTTLLAVGESQFGIQVSGGDFNGDGYTDLAAFENQGLGIVHIFHGASSGLSGTVELRISTSTAQGTIRRLQAAGDVNADGYDDLLVGRNGEDATGTVVSSIDVHYGSATGLAVSPDLQITQSDTGFGYQFISDTDFDLDGIDDILILTEGGSSDWLYIVYGDSAGVSTTPTSLAASYRSAVVEYPSAVLVSVGDVNGDGYPETMIHNTVEYGSSAGPGSGTTLSLPTTGQAHAAGDLNGDGYADVVVFNPYSYYSANIYYGDSSGLNRYHADDSINDGLGEGIGALGDIDGDGYDDLLVGAPDEGSRGIAYLHMGTATGINTSPSSLFPGPTGCYNYGAVMLGGVDFNGDGIGDAISGDHRYNIRQGMVETLLADGTGGIAADAILEGQESAGDYGSSLALLGDVNGDGYPDAVVGAEGSYGSGTSSGRAFVYLGASTGLHWDPYAVLDGPGAGDEFGASAADAGDVNGDGLADFLVGAYTTYGDHAAYLFYGSTSSITLSSATAIVEPGLGYTLDGAGDVDGDGYDDVVLGVGSSSEAAYVQLGSTTGIATEPDIIISSEGSRHGTGVAGVGDVNGDGYDDVAVASPSSTTGSDTVYIYHGGAAGPDTSPDLSLTCPDTTCLFGHAMDGGDVNGDGFDDLIVGAPYANSRLGSVYVYYGTSSGSSSVVGATINGTQSNAFWGSKLAIGDLDSDGYADVAIGAYKGYISSSYGRVDVFKGDGGGLQTTADTQLSAIAQVSYLGQDLSGGHDVDQDGFDDLFVAADGYAMLHRGFYDGDGDGIGSADDCDDTDPSVGLPEIYAYPDSDGDGYGRDGEQTLVCSLTSGFAAEGGDCDDATSTVHPEGTELPGDGIDQDCDETEVCYVDADGDGYRTGSASDLTTSSDLDCDDPGEASDGTPRGDCDDSDPSVSPGQAEVPANGVDEDCDGNELCYADVDEDGVAPDHSTTVVSVDLSCDASGEASTDAPTGDCNDYDDSVFPGATESTGDGVDQDCDGQEVCFVDADGDGFRSPDAHTVVSDDSDCEDLGEALAEVALDCDDSDPSVFPGAEDVAGDGTDQDCDGSDGARREAGGAGDSEGETSDKSGCDSAPVMASTSLTLWAFTCLYSRRRRTPIASAPSRT